MKHDIFFAYTYKRYGAKIVLSCKLFLSRIATHQSFLKLSNSSLSRFGLWPKTYSRFTKMSRISATIRNFCACSIKTILTTKPTSACCPLDLTLAHVRNGICASQVYCWLVYPEPISYHSYLVHVCSHIWLSSRYHVYLRFSVNKNNVTDVVLLHGPLFCVLHSNDDVPCLLYTSPSPRD